MGEEALLGSSVISCSLGDWSQAAFTGAERKTWPSQRLFKISPVRKRVEGTAADDEIAESLRGLKRAQLQKIAKTLRINPTQPTEQLVAEIAECTSSVLRQRDDAPPARDADAVMREAEWADLTEAERSAASLLGYSAAGWDSGDRAQGPEPRRRPLQAPWDELEAEAHQRAAATQALESHAAQMVEQVEQTHASHAEQLEHHRSEHEAELLARQQGWAQAAGEHGDELAELREQWHLTAQRHADEVKQLQAEVTQLRRLTVSGNQLRWVCGCGWRYWGRTNIENVGESQPVLIMKDGA